MDLVEQIRFHAFILFWDDAINLTHKMPFPKMFRCRMIFMNTCRMQSFVFKLHLSTKNDPSSLAVIHAECGLPDINILPR